MAEKPIDELRGLAAQHTRDAKFTPARQVVGMQNYRNSKGERIGMPLKPNVEGEVFDNMVLSGINPREASGPLSGFGNFLVKQGHLDDVYGDRTTLPEGGADVAEQDLYDEGTPGRGTEIDGEKSFDALRSAANRVIARRTVAQWKRDLGVLENRFDIILKQAQICENKGDLDKAALWDRKAISLGRTIRSLKDKIQSRELYERQAAAPVEENEYEEVPSGLAGFDNLEDQLGLEQ